MPLQLIDLGTSQDRQSMDQRNENKKNTAQKKERVHHATEEGEQTRTTAKEGSTQAPQIARTNNLSPKA